ncbi:hypothetical protein [Brevibacterium aurantiacum]|uniref:Immunity repressor n=1 Tax=Brevibacterium aurantiacum TaxID=273384 RepID=A0A556C1P7_BREAU|nr:hypothetical protein [Brevibacterium aurantiacum]TSI11310.1 hypothetical protein FO013_21930 [Brevibacterium aurantiacum]
MADELRTLQDLAQLATERHDGKRGRALGREAAKHELTLSYTTFDNILAGKYMSTPKRETIDALAFLAGVPKETAYRVAGLPLPLAPIADQLPPDVDTLDADQRRVLIELARVLVKQNRRIHDLEKAGDGSEHSATSMNDAEGNSAEEQLAVDFTEEKKRRRTDNVRRLHETPYFTDPPAAEDTAAFEAPNRGRKIREEQDADAERPDVTDDEENE